MLADRIIRWTTATAVTGVAAVVAAWSRSASLRTVACHLRWLPLPTCSATTPMSAPDRLSAVLPAEVE
jgi:hypothetical protein